MSKKDNPIREDDEEQVKLEKWRIGKRNFP